MITVEERKTALVISGGGAKGAFAVGVVKHLYLTYRNTGWFDIIGGTSTGALIAPMAALMAGPRPMATKVLDTLLRMYTNVSTPDILRERNIFDWFERQDCLNESDPLNRLVHRELRPKWFKWLQSSRAPDCYVVYVNYQTGKKVTVSPKDKGMNRERFIQAMLASASVPIIMEASVINRKDCFDGGVRDLLPFGKAIELGAETIVPIFLDPEEFSKTRSRFKRIDRILLRTFEIMVDETGRNDFKVAELVNIGIRLKQEILSAFPPDTTEYQKLEKIFRKKKFQSLIGKGKHLVKLITGLRPDEPLKNEMVFEPRKMRRWVKLGTQKARKVIKQSPFV